jgi:hypothetical protein
MGHGDRGRHVLRGRCEIQELLRPAPDKGIYLVHDRVLDRPVVIDVFSNNSISVFLSPAPSGDRPG